MRKENDSFTIIELLVVMAIIGILVTLSIVGIQQAQKSTRVTRINNTTLLLKAELTKYYNEFRQYPVSLWGDTTNSVVFMCNPKFPECGANNAPYTSSNVYSYVKADQAGFGGMQQYLSEDGAHSESSQCINGGSVNEENWLIYYSANSLNRPQSFYLASCSENGWKEFSETPLPASN
ncbi:MAG: type II secretion system protein [bacterium]